MILDYHSSMDDMKSSIDHPSDIQYHPSMDDNLRDNIWTPIPFHCFKLTGSSAICSINCCRHSLPGTAPCILLLDNTTFDLRQAHNIQHTQRCFGQHRNYPDILITVKAKNNENSLPDNARKRVSTVLEHSSAVISVFTLELFNNNLLEIYMWHS